MAQQHLDGFQAALARATELAAQLPDASDIAFERTLDRKLASDLDAGAAHVFELAQSILSWATFDNSPASRPSKRLKTATGKPLDADLVRDGAYRDAVDHVEALLEAADGDVELALNGPSASTPSLPAPAAAQSQTAAAAGGDASQPLPAKMRYDSSIPKPQLAWSTRLRVQPPALDDPNPIWRPLMRRKGSITASDWLQLEQVASQDDEAEPAAAATSARSRYRHPYADEIATAKPPESFYNRPKARDKLSPSADSLASRPFVLIDSAEALRTMLDEITTLGRRLDKKGKAKELAVDLEHHNYRSWAGITCLVQMSTRSKDYVIDVLQPAVREAMEDLNVVFADPTWIKVLQGARMDILWLQRDLGLYVVGLFDTYEAACILDFERRGLGALLERYTDFKPDKRYQLADWRIRPLSPDMLLYARADTHFLLDIYDEMRAALHDASHTSIGAARERLDEVLRLSSKTASQTYNFDPYDRDNGQGDDGWLQAMPSTRRDRTLVSFKPSVDDARWAPGKPSFEVFRALHAWREATARAMDESARYILPTPALDALARQLPTARPAVLAVLGTVKGGRTPPACEHASAIATLIQQTVSSLANGIKPPRRDTRLRSDGLPIAAGASDDDAALVQPSSTFFGGVHCISTPPAQTLPVAIVHRQLLQSSQVASSLAANADAFKASAQQEQQSDYMAGIDVQEIDYVGLYERQAPSPVAPAQNTDVRSGSEGGFENVVVSQLGRKSTSKAKPKPSVNADKHSAITPFDFASRPSILDQSSRTQGQSYDRKKSTSGKKRTHDGGDDFGRAPRTYNAPKKGNLNATFTDK